MLMHNPPDPGETIKELCLVPLGLSVTAAADGLGGRRPRHQRRPFGS